MAAANASGDAARVYIDESDSDDDFEGFTASDCDIEQASNAIHRNSDDEVDIDDLILDSDSASCLCLR